MGKIILQYQTSKLKMLSLCGEDRTPLRRPPGIAHFVGPHLWFRSLPPADHGNTLTLRHQLEKITHGAFLTHNLASIPRWLTQKARRITSRSSPGPSVCSWSPGKGICGRSITLNHPGTSSSLSWGISSTLTRPWNWLPPHEASLPGILRPSAAQA